MATGILVLMLLLTVGFLGTRVAAHLEIPHSVLLVFVGVVSGVLTQGTSVESSAFITTHFPELVLFLLLPPLIFEAAYDLDYASFRRDLVPISALAVVALFASTAMVGYGLHLAFGLKLLPSLTFGALISATDPVGVVALFKEMGAPTRLRTLLEGESLLNDGTSIVLFRILMAASLGITIGSPTAGWGLLQFLGVSLGGVLVGLVIAVVTGFLQRLTVASEEAQLGLTIVAAYTSFLLADHFLGASGVIATMTVGMVLGKQAKDTLSTQALGAMRPVWKLLALGANTVVFFAVGLTVEPAQLLLGLHFIPLTLAIVYLARTISVLVTTWLVAKLRFSKPISAAFQVVIIWGGIRGGLAMALVLTLPELFPHKKLFVALATSVVFSTLFINALTTKKVLKLLKLTA